MSHYVVKRPIGWVNPYAEQNAKIPGYFHTEGPVPNTPLPGIVKPASGWYAPLDVLQAISRRATYTNENDGWTKVVNKRHRRRARNYAQRITGWAGAGAGAVEAPETAASD